MKLRKIYETFWDDGEYDNELSYERADDPPMKGNCISVELYAFEESELKAVWEAARSHECQYLAFEDWLKAQEVKRNW